MQHCELYQSCSSGVFSKESFFTRTVTDPIALKLSASFCHSVRYGMYKERDQETASESRLCISPDAPTDLQYTPARSLQPSSP